MNTRLTLIRVIWLIVLSVLLRGMPHAIASPVSFDQAPVVAESATGCPDHVTTDHRSPTPHQNQDSVCKISCELTSAAALLTVLPIAASQPRPVMVAQAQRLALGLETPPDHPPPI